MLGLNLLLHLSIHIIFGEVCAHVRDHPNVERFRQALDDSQDLRVHRIPEHNRLLQFLELLFRKILRAT